MPLLSHLSPHFSSFIAGGILLARENETTATIAGVGLVAVILPGTRRLLWRMTLGRLQSAEAAQKSAELRVQSLATRLTEHDGEVQKLSERLALARQEYERGLSKLQGAASELRSLSSRVEGTERKAKGEPFDAISRDTQGLVDAHIDILFTTVL